MVEIPFFKKMSLPKFSLEFLKGRPERSVGVDFGLYSAKTVQLRYEKGRAILETYGEILNAGRLKETEGTGSGFLRYRDSDIASLLKDLFREANITAQNAAFAIPANASFITIVPFPRLSESEIKQAIPFEARKYVPIPVSEVMLDWDILREESDEESQETINVILVAVPHEVIEKFKRITELAGIKLAALEVETFSMVRSLTWQDSAATLVLNVGHQLTTAAVAKAGKLYVSHNIGRGSQELTRALERGMSISWERAEAVKREIGLSPRLEDRETSSVIAPLVETLFLEIERMVSIYNRRSESKIQRIILTGAGSNLPGLLDYAGNKFGLEVSKGNPFARIVTPAFMQPLLREIAPSFSVAVGLALREISVR